MKVKTKDLLDAQLDWAVCMALGMKPESIYIWLKGTKNASLFRRNRDEEGNLDGSYTTGPDLLFSRMWEAGGPVMNREITGVDLISERAGVQRWSARKFEYLPRDKTRCTEQEGPTMLVAGMRCFVASKLGDVVEIPKELTCK